jgi:hypothetical protein
MLWVNPLPISCEACGFQAAYRVNDLLNLAAKCARCGASLRQVGEKMRKAADDEHSFVTLIELVVALEDMIGHEISDLQIKDVHTLRDLAGVIENILPPGADSRVRAEEMVKTAAMSMRGDDTPAPLDFAVPLLEAVKGVKR